MRKIYTLLAGVLACSFAHAQLTGIKSVPTDYPTLAAAITALNTQGVGAGGVTIDVTAGNAQTAPSGGYVIGGAGSALLTSASAANPVTIRGNGNTITAAAAQSAGSITDAIVKIVGADYITLQAFVLQENSANTTTALASNNMTEWGVALLTASATDGAQHNTIRNNQISLNRTYLNTFGIYSNTRHTSTTPGTAAESTSADGSNSFNTVHSNTISNVNYAVVFVGSGTVQAAMDQGNDIGGSSAATRNTITDFGGGSATGTYVSVTPSNYAIYLNQQLNDNASYNDITSGNGVSVGATQHGGIFKAYTVAAPVAGTVTVSNFNGNRITLNTAATTAQVTGITVQGMTTLASATININDNYITGSISGSPTSAAFVAILGTSAPGTLNINNNRISGVTSAATTGAFVAIQQQTNGVVNAININNNQIGEAGVPAVTFSAATHSGAITGIAVVTPGAAATCQVRITGNELRGIVNNGTASGGHVYFSNSAACAGVDISNNRFNALNVKTTGSVTFISNNVTFPENAVITVNNNQIVGGYTKTGAGGTVAFYNANTNATATTNETNNGNNFSNITLTGATTVTGWVSTNGTTTSPYGPTKTVSNNTFSNITGGTSAMTILSVGYSNANGGSSVFNNVVENITGGGAVTGISIGQGVHNVYGNTVSGLSGSGTGAVTGLSVTSGLNNTVYRNKIYNLVNSNAGGTAIGMTISGGTTVTAHNNLIGDIRATAASGANVLMGINISSSTAAANLYYNTVYINGSSSGTNFGSSALFANSGATLDLRNNILVNTSTAAGTGLTAAFRRSSTTLTSYASASNNNLFYAGTPSASNLIFYDGTNSDQTLAAFQTRVGAPRDVSSVTENIVPFFQSVAGSNSNFLHITPGSTTLAESGGANIAGLPTDYDGDVRYGNSGYTGTGRGTDIGADEFEGSNPTPSCTPPAGQGSALTFGTSTSSTQPATFTAPAAAPTGYLIIRSSGAFTGTPVSGTSYAPGNTIGNGTVVSVSTTPSFTASGLSSNTEYTYTIYSYATGACVGGPVFNLSAPLTGTATTCAGTPTALGVSGVNSTGFTLAWTAPAGGSAGPLQYTVEVATDNAFASIVSTQTVSATTVTIGGLNGSTTYYYRVRANNGVCASANTATASIGTTCTGPALTQTNGASRCGTGTLTLTGTPASGVVNWYSSATATTPIFTGNSFTTPVLNNTTTYYAEAASSGTPFTAGQVSDAAANLGSFGGYGMYFSTQNQVTINSVDIYPSTAGTLNVYLYDGAGNPVDIRTFTIAAGDISTTVKKTLNLGFRVPAGATDWVLYYDLPINRGGGSYTYGTTVNGFTIRGNTIDGAPITSGTRYYFYNWNLTQICTSPRVAVTATITAAPAISAVATPSSICAGESSNLNVSSANSGYTYNWTPGGLSGAAQTVSPATTTTYTVTATDNSGGASNGCQATQTVTVNVSATPSAITLTPGNTSICATEVARLTASGGGTSGALLLNEDFNGNATGWTTSNLSVGGNVAAAAWHPSPSGQYWFFETISSPDNSQFYVSSSDAQGSGGTSTQTYLNAPVVNTTGFTSLTLNFAHYYRFLTGEPTDSAAVQVSTDNVTWTTVKTYKAANAGSGTAFDNASINLDAFANKPALYIRFRYSSLFGYYWMIDNVTLSGTQTPSFSWTPVTGLYTDAAATIPYTGGMTSTVYAKPASTTVYTATAINGARCTRSANATVTIASNTTISTQPAANQSVCAGENVSFTVAASGGTLSYQWLKNGNQIGGANSATYTINGVTAADAGTYSVYISGSCNNVTSSDAVLTVNARTAISTQPVDQMVCQGGNATFTVAASGSGTLSYQWLKNGNQIGGANSATYTINGVTAADYGAYSVEVMGSCGNLTSNTANLQFCTAVSNIDETVSTLLLTPNPVRNSATLQVTANRAARIEWQIVDSKGSVVRRFTQRVSAGNNALPLSLGDLAGGNYLLYGVTDKGKTATLRFVRL